MLLRKTVCLLAAALLLSVGALALAAAETEETADPTAWPREYSNEKGAKLILYQPQVTEWEEFERLEARVALALTVPAAETPSLGTFELEMATEVDLETRQVRASEARISKHHFPTIGNEASTQLLAYLEELLPKDELILSLDRILANLERTGTVDKGVETKTTPPTIFVSERPAVLVLFDGKPMLGWS